MTARLVPSSQRRALCCPGEPVALQPSELPRLDAVLISHHHYDHCDLAAFAAYRDKGVPMIVAGPVASRGRAAGFTDVRALQPWETAPVGDLTITAAPGKHAVYEITFVVRASGRSVYFAGDTMLIPELRTLPDRFGRFDVALLPVNGLQIRPQLNKQVVMNAEQAAELTAVLAPGSPFRTTMPSPAGGSGTGSSPKATAIPATSSQPPSDSHRDQSSRYCSPANP